MAEQPPLNRSYVISYAGNDRDYPVIGLRLDPRVAGYRVPEDLSPHPDSKRYPNHVFTGSQPSNGDERVTHVYEILPAPWVPFTRYDDDLGPVQGRRRSVKNEGQQASLTSSTKTSYEGREGSAIVSNEIEETWSIKVDEDGNSLFPIKDRDFYDASRGAVQERRQLFVPTGEEVGTLENVGGVITQTSYEPYNEFLSVKIVQTYKTDGPQLIGNTTDNDGQLVTITTQRKAALDYVPPNPTATRTVEISREDAESLIERIIDTPEVFKADTFSVERPDPIPQKFRVAVPIRSSQEVVEGVAEIPTLEEGEISRSEEQRNKFLKRVSATSRDQTVLPQTLIQKSTNNERQEVTVTETLQSGDTEEVATATKTIESEALGDGNYVVRKTEIPEVFAGEIYRKTKEDLTPQKFRASQEEDIFEETIEGTAESPTLGSGEFAKSEQQVDKFTKRISTTFRDIEVATSLDEEVVTPEGIVAKRTLRLSKDPQSINPDEKLIDGSIEALGDGRTIKTEVRVPKIFAATTFSVERPDAVPQKFRVSVPVTTKQETIVGNAEEPSLGEGEITKSEQQTTEFLKRISTSSRDKTQLPKTLTQKTTTNEGQLATVEEKLQQGDTLEQPSATKTIESEAVGDGTYIVRKTEVPKIFAGASFRVTKADLTPEKFRASQEDVVKEETVAGNAEQPALSEGEFAKTEQQITEFVKRISTTKRSTEEAQELTESVLTNDGQIGVRKLTLSDGPQEIEESELVVDASIEALGDGRTIKTEVKVPEVFDARVLSVERPDTTPAKFRASVPVKNEQFTKKGAITEPVLQDGDLSKSEQQQTKYVKRVSTSSRDQTKLPSSLEQKTTNEFKQVVNIKETLQNGDTSVTPTATKTVESEALGDGNYVVRTSEVDDFFRAKSFSVESPDVVPAKFRSKSPTETTQEIIEGDAELPSLSDGEIAKSEQQQDEFLKRISTTTRDKTQLPVSLFQKTTTEQGLLATVSETLQSGDTIVTPTALRSVDSEALGDGNYVVRVTNLPKVFAGETFSVEKPDPLPQKFRVAAKTLTTQKTEEGTAEQPDLVTGELSKSEQQVTEFVKRTSTTSRDQAQLPVILIQRAVDNDRQSVTVTETLQTTGPIEPNSATVTIQSEALGDGNFVVTKSEVPEVFSAESYQKTKADLTPQKFRAAQEDLVFEETVEGEAQEPNLSEDEFAKTEQQVNKFVKRVSTTTRSIEETTELSEKVLTPQGQIGTRTLTLSKQNQSFTPSATLVDANVEALGDGRTIKTEVVVPIVFANKTISKTKADLTPQKFRSAQEDTTTEETLAGEITEPSLAENEFSKSEQQVTEFVKRVTTNVRDIETSTTLEEKVVTPDGQLATRTLRLSKEAQTIDPDELTVDGSIEALGDGRTIKTETKAPSVLELPVFSVERPDATPAKFRVAVPTATEQKTIVGDAEQPSLEEGEISKSEQQQTKFVKRTTVTKRDQDQLPKTLTQKTTTNEGLLATVTETLKEGDTTEQPNATKTVESESLGDGNYVVRITETPKIFVGKTFSVEKPDVLPQKFRASVQSVTEQETIEGDAEQPNLSSGEISKSEQQVTEFIKRTSTTSRDETSLPVTLTQKATNQEKQLVTITETLQQGNTTEQPSSKIDIQSEAIGDGKYIITKTESPEVFKAETFRAEKADLTPQKFRSKQIDLTKEETIEGTATEPFLGENEFSKTEQQVNKFVKRVTTTERETDVTETLNEKVLTPDGQLADRTITLSKSNQTIVPSATVIDGDIEALGDGRTVKTEVKVSQVFDGKQESLEKPEVIPPEFRASLQNRTISEIKEGQAISLPSLSQGELSKTIQRVTEHKIRETKVTRPSDDYPELTGELVDNDQIRVTRTRTVAKGGQTITPSATVSGSVEALGDGYTLKTEDTKEKVFEAKTFSKEKPDNIPVEFRVEKPASTEEYNEEGDASEVSLADSEIAKSEQQVNEFVKRVRTTTRDDVGGVSLSGEQVDQDGVKVKVERQLSKGTQSISPSETVRGEVQNLGGGYTIKTTLTRDEVLELPSFSVEKPDVVPAAFRSQIQTTTEEKTITGDAEEPTLNDEDISKTERQIDKFLKRTTKVSRPETVSGELVGEQIENDGIKSTVTRTLSDGAQSITPSATVSGNVEDIGDGLTIKTEIVKERVFSEKVFSIEKPDNIPVEFRVEKPLTTEEFTEEGEAQQAGLSGDEISKSEQQVTEFLKRTRTAKRDLVGGIVLGGGQQIDQDGILSTVVRTLDDGAQTITPTARVSGSVEAIGGGKTIKTELTKENIFDQDQTTLSQTIQIPAKFIDRDEKQESYIEENETATPEPLGDGGFGVVQSSAQRVSEFTVRKNFRTISGPNSLSEKQLSNSGQEITIESSISDDSSIEVGSKIEIARTQAIGGGKFLKEIGRVEEVFSGRQKTLSQSVQVPSKFFNGDAIETSFIEEGTEAEPEDVGSDGFGVTQSSSQRINAFLRRQTKTEQSGVTSLSEQQTNNSGQKVIVDSSIGDSPEVETGPLVEFSRTQAIGGGRFVKEVGKVEEVFAGSIFSSEKPETIPAKFRVDIPNTTEEMSEIGEAHEVELSKGELSKSEQQIREGVKRTRTTKRADIPSASFVQKSTNQERQLLTVTETLQEGDTSDSPSAIKTIQSEAIGDGRYIVTVSETDEIFGAQSVTRERPDVTPTKFRADIPTQIQEFNSVGEAETPVLTSDDISETQQQINKFVKRTSRTSRPSTSAQAEGEVYVSDLNGGTAKVIENFGLSPNIDPSFGTISAEKEYLGGGKYLTREVKLETLATLSGQNYDDTFDIAIPFTREIIEAGELALNESAEVDPRNSLHSVKTLIDKQALTDALDDYHVIAGDIQNVSLPDVLLSVSLKITNEESKSDSSSGDGNSASAGGSVEIQSRPTLNYVISSGYSGPAKATRHMFFLPEENCGYSAIQGKTNSLQWPIVRPRPERVEIVTFSERKSLTIQKSLPNNIGRSGSASKTASIASLSIPPTLHGEVALTLSDVDGPTSSSVTVSVTAPDSGTVARTLNVEALTKEYVIDIRPTSPPAFPAGNYLYGISVSPYRYGYVRVDAVVVEVTGDMVAVN